MDATALAKFARHSHRKVRQIGFTIRGKPALKALDLLSFMPKAAATVVGKALRSAVANASRFAKPEQLRVVSVWVGQGPKIKRFHAGPQGRGMPYSRKTCHVEITVTDGKKAAA